MRSFSFSLALCLMDDIFGPTSAVIAHYYFVCVLKSRTASERANERAIHWHCHLNSDYDYGGGVDGDSNSRVLIKYGHSCKYACTGTHRPFHSPHSLRYLDWPENEIDRIHSFISRSFSSNFFLLFGSFFSFFS